MTGLILDGMLMLLLVTALGYGVRLEKKLTSLRAGQLAFANAVNDLNTAAARAEAALSSLRLAGEEADMLHDRILKARAVKQELEGLIARSGRSASPSPSAETGWGRQGEPDSDSVRVTASPQPGRSAATLPMKGRESVPAARAEALADPADDRAFRMAALAERIQGIAAPRTAEPRAAEPGRDNVSAILSALNAARGGRAEPSRANQAAQPAPNRPARSLDDDLFAA